MRSITLFQPLIRMFDFEIQQDTIVQPQQRQEQSFPSLAVPKPQLDLERAEEMMKQFEQREQEIIVAQDSVKKTTPRNATIRNATLPDVSISDVSVADSAKLKIVELEIVESFNPAAYLIHAERQVGYPSSVTLFIACGLVLLAFIRFNFAKNLLDAFHSFFNFRKSVRLYEEHRESDRQAAFLSNVLFIWITGIFISIVLPFFGANPLWGSYEFSVLFFSAATGLLYILKSFIWQTLGVVFMAQNLSKIYIYNMFLYNRNIGLMIFPLVSVIPFVSKIIMFYMVYSVIGVFVLSYLFKWWRIFQTIHTRNVSVFYFILYLCSLEILPLLLLAKGCKMLSELNLFL